MEPMADALTSDTNPTRLQCCPLIMSAQKKDLGKCFLSPLLTRSTKGGTRTLTGLLQLDFESSASANSATSASGDAGVYLPLY